MARSSGTESVSHPLRGDLGELSLRYHGPALDHDHSMNAKVLAPALLSFSDAVEVAKNEVLPYTQVELRVKATRPGSFDIQFILQSVDAFSQTSAGGGLAYLAGTGGLTLYTIIIGAVKLASWFRHHAGARIVSNEPADDDGMDVFSEHKVIVESADGTRIQTYDSCLRIARKRKFVNNVGKAMAGPSSQEGVDGAELSSGGDSVDVDHETARSMAEWVPPEDVIGETDMTVTVQPLDAHFEPGKKWHVTSGNDVKYTVDMCDDDFIDAVENGERIGKKDIFKVTIHAVSARARDGELKTRYSITKVLEHKPYKPPVQGELEL